MVRERPQTRASHTVRVNTSSWASIGSAHLTLCLLPAEVCPSPEGSGPVDPAHRCWLSPVQLKPSSSGAHAA
eukprot:4778991-Alexandrium_andersonii.AAC.1